MVQLAVSPTVAEAGVTVLTTVPPFTVTVVAAWTVYVRSSGFGAVSGVVWDAS